MHGHLSAPNASPWAGSDAPGGGELEWNPVALARRLLGECCKWQASRGGNALHPRASDSTLRGDTAMSCPAHQSPAIRKRIPAGQLKNNPGGAKAAPQLWQAASTDREKAMARASPYL